jgi:GntR family transcriptional regulator, rspAB operon transcriptional repressor
MAEGADTLIFAKLKLDRSQPLREQVYELLRRFIVSGVIAPGDTIDDEDIAAQLQISRTPVREAIKKLSDEHLVDVIAQSGTRAARIDAHEVRQAFLIRRALEMESAAQAAANMTALNADALRDIHQRHARAIERADYTTAIGIDDQFHRHIASISNLPRLWRAIEISKAHLDRCRHKMLTRTGEAQATLQQHMDIITSLESQNPEAARSTMQRHLDSAMATTEKMLEQETSQQGSPFSAVKQP